MPAARSCSPNSASRQFTAFPTRRKPTEASNSTACRALWTSSLTLSGFPAHAALPVPGKCRRRQGLHKLVKRKIKRIAESTAPSHWAVCREKVGKDPLHRALHARGPRRLRHPDRHPRGWRHLGQPASRPRGRPGLHQKQAAYHVHDPCLAFLPPGHQPVFHLHCNMTNDAEFGNFQKGSSTNPEIRRLAKPSPRCWPHDWTLDGKTSG